jgi:hypothetical protein
LSNGVTLWEGRGAVDSAPLVAVLTGLHTMSDNPKTGPMPQGWLLRRDIEPTTAISTGQDASVCNDCAFRPTAGVVVTRCYVNVAFAPLAIYRAYHRGLYPRATRRELPDLLRWRRVRLGAYGNFSNAPWGLTRDVARASAGWTLYEHNWRAEHAQPLRRYAMASVASEAEKAEANGLGWVTYRTKHPREPRLPDEVVCPASKEAGRRLTCDRCLLCRGTSGPGKNVVIDDHGPTAGRFSLPLTE